jgi:hypothetical protein
MNNPRHYNQNLFSKWLLIAVLFLSFFTFGVPTGQSSIKPEAQQTTLLVGNPARFARSTSFNSTLPRICNKGVANSFLVATALNLINLHSRQINTRLKNHSRFKSTGIQNGFFYCTKAISPNTGDDLLPLLG